MANRCSQKNLRVRVRVYDLDGKIRADKHADGIRVDSGGAFEALKLPRYPEISPVFFVRCELLDEKGKVLAENVYWQSQKDDDVGDPKNDGAFGLKPDSWADMTALNSMPKAALEVSATKSSAGSAGGETRVTIRLHNPTQHVGFFEHAEITSAKDGDEILPIEYDNNYVTVFPGETVEIKATLPASAAASWIKFEGYNTPQAAVAIK